jgi:hypothetical protein
MLRGGALIFAIILALLISIISSSLIMFGYLNSIETEIQLNRNRVMRNVSSGLTLLMGNQTIVGLNETKTLDFFSEGTDTITLTRKAWGGFEVVCVKGKSGGFEYERSAILGIKETDTLQALYLADLDRQLAICGKTVLKGACRLPRSGIKRAYIEGQNFTGDKFVHGNIQNSSQNVPSLNKDHIETLKNEFRSGNESDSLLSYYRGEPGDSTEVSFLNKTLSLSSEGIIILDQHFSGNIKIISRREIRIMKGASLENILLFAPIIRIEKGFTGRLQAFASDSLLVEEDVKLLYPSILACLRNTFSPFAIYLGLGKKSEVTGCVFADNGETSDIRKNAHISLDENSKVTGQVYSSMSLDLKGNVFGSVCCRTFLLKTSSGVYENHLLNATIDRTELSKHYLGSNLLHPGERKGVLKWL